MTGCLLDPFCCSWAQEGDQLWGEEQFEMAEFSFDYLSCVELINEFHPKFYRSHPDWLQVTAAHKALSI